jgi:hypothetical protein
MRILMSIVIAAFASSTFASPKCTTEPKNKWKPETDIRAKAEAAGHKIDVFKVTKGGCYEIYGRDADGKRIELYFNPMSGDVVGHS